LGVRIPPGLPLFHERDRSRRLSVPAAGCAGVPASARQDQEPDRERDRRHTMNWFNKLKEFLQETRSEIRKVSFPSRDEVVGTTIIVLITSFVFAVYLYGVDILIQKGYIELVRIFER
jgi:preprotein translocase subunit SecE